jgi:hypothetical protein
MKEKQKQKRSKNHPKLKRTNKSTPKSNHPPNGSKKGILKASPFPKKKKAQGFDQGGHNQVHDSPSLFYQCKRRAC